MKKILILVFLLTSANTFSQKGVLRRSIDDQGILSHLVFDNTVSFITLESANKLLRDSLKLTNDDDLFPFKEFTDDYGFLRKLYRQHYKGVVVEDGFYAVCATNGNIKYISGEFKKIPELDIVPSVMLIMD